MATAGPACVDGTDGHARSAWVVELGPVRHGVSLASGDRALLECIARYFDAAEPVACDAAGADLRCRLEHEAGGTSYVLEGLARDARQSSADLAVFVERLDQAVDEIVAASTRRDFLVLHASAVEEPDGEAVLFVGRSLAGKSTTATLFALAGHALFGDECLALRLGGAGARASVLRWRRPLSLREDVLEIVAEKAGWTDADRAAVLVTRRKRLVPAADLLERGVLAGGRRVDELPLGRLVWIDPSAEVDGPIESGAVFRELVAACHYFQRDGAELFASLAELARNAPCARVRPGERVIERVRALSTVRP